jgi:hypothetical protein
VVEEFLVDSNKIKFTIRIKIGAKVKKKLVKKLRNRTTVLSGIRA